MANGQETINEDIIIYLLTKTLSTIPGIFFPYQEDGALPAYLVAMNSYDVANDMEVSVDIKPRSRTGIIFAVGGTTGDNHMGFDFDFFET